jgi:hypothetical protein
MVLVPLHEPTKIELIKFTSILSNGLAQINPLFTQLGTKYYGNKVFKLWQVSLF